MELKRAGVLLFGVGLCLSLLSAVAFGVVSASTEALCQNHDPAYSIDAVDLSSLYLLVSDGCNSHVINPLVTGGTLLAVVGLVVGGAGVAREWSAAD